MTDADERVVLWVELRVRAESVEQFVTVAAELAARSLADEEGCLHYDVVELDAAERVYGIYEVYRDADAVTAHGASEHYAVWKAVAGTFFEEDGKSVRRGRLL
ncbi:antibiotic biosynthesis monooxygenase [Herbiconiux moechotypicola]|uniref:ABM domain-containing protein n=1 Tax=Herbiconiux moechotypicola TaxID=637393 RepID=A0ABN3D9A7_9MICO|nr:antibiotic biosynthesis monooxygenase [Herbiconiux moechotypicola]MCS5728193.1 antibiotic biosynthesis monooxygenase [Herbiconiux moechotypicola]